MRRPWRESECMPFLVAAQSTLLRVLSLKPSICKDVTRWVAGHKDSLIVCIFTRYSLRSGAVISFVLRNRRFPSDKSACNWLGTCRARGKLAVFARLCGLIISIDTSPLAQLVRLCDDPVQVTHRFSHDQHRQHQHTLPLTNMIT